MSDLELVSAAEMIVKSPMLPSDTDMRQPHARWRLQLAYGKWTTANGREVVYNRRYRPIWHRLSAGEPWSRAEYAEFVRDIVGHEWFYNDGHGERQKVRRATESTRRLGMPDIVPAAVSVTPGNGNAARGGPPEILSSG
jgi:hypothetical protein